MSKGLAGVYQRIARKEQADFLDASVYASPSSIDQEHLTEEGHRLLAGAILQKIREIEAQAAA